MLYQTPTFPQPDTNNVRRGMTRQIVNLKSDKTAMLYQTPNISTALQESSLLQYTKNVRRGMTRQIVNFKPGKTAMLYQTPTFPQPDKSLLYSQI